MAREGARSISSRGSATLGGGGYKELTRDTGEESGGRERESQLHADRRQRGLTGVRKTEEGRGRGRCSQEEIRNRGRSVK